MSALLELAERCEQATGPNLALDASIANSLDAQGGWVARSRANWPPFTVSLDAALTLVPEGWVENYQRRFDSTTIAACHQGGSGRQTLGVAATPALALCAAALRARAASVIETQRATTEGRGPQDESAASEAGDAQ